MSGLTAIVHLDGTPVDPGLVAACNAAAAHRGTSMASHLDGPTALAYLGPVVPATPRVLSCTLEGTVSIVLAGALYNRQEVAAALGVETARTDPALMLLAYRRWGAMCVARFDGDFAFVLHDAVRNVVVCARDALGSHPLCYAFDGGRLVAASEPRQVLAAGIAMQPSEDAIATYIAAARHLYGGPQTFYKNVFRVEPGHVLEVDRRGPRSQRYWQLDPNRQLEERTDAEMAHRVRQLMIDAVERRVPDVGPYACALSGGFDSSSVAALMRLVLRPRTTENTTLETFSFELRDAAADEPELIEAVSTELGTNHHAIFLDQDNVFSLLPQMLAASDEPIFDMGLLYLWRKKERAAQHGVRVILSGLGGDELFVGQFHFLFDLLTHLRLPTLWSEIKGIYPVDRTKGMPTSLRKILQFYVFGPAIPRSVKRLTKRIATGQGSVPPWVDRSLARRVGLAARIERGPQRLYADAYRQDCFEVFTSSLVNTTLPLHESLGAAFGVETRFPLLDRRLVEYMFAASREQKIRGGEVRLLQRRAMRGILPEVVLQRHVKKNLNVVLRRQQHGHFVAELKTLFSGRPLRAEAYLDRAYLRDSYRRYLASGEQDAAVPLWYAMNLERWLEAVTK